MKKNIISILIIMMSLSLYSGELFLEIGPEFEYADYSSLNRNLKNLGYKGVNNISGRVHGQIYLLFGDRLLIGSEAGTTVTEYAKKKNNNIQKRGEADGYFLLGVNVLKSKKFRLIPYIGIGASKQLIKLTLNSTQDFNTFVSAPPSEAKIVHKALLLKAAIKFNLTGKVEKKIFSKNKTFYPGGTLDIGIKYMLKEKWSTGHVLELKNGPSIPDFRYYANLSFAIGKEIKKHHRGKEQLEK